MGPVAGSWLQQRPPSRTDVILHLKAKPGSKIDRLLYDAAGALTVKIRAPAQDGKANAYLVEYLAQAFGLAKSKVTLLSGFTGPHKKIEVLIDEAAELAVLNRLQ